MQRTRIAIFEDNNDLRDSLAMIIESVPEFYLAGSFSNAARLILKIEQSKPDVVLMDINMPGLSGIEAVAQIHQQYPSIKIMMQTIFEEDDKVFASLCAGASGYILKNTPPERVLQAIREVAEGGAFFTPSIARKVLSNFQLHQATPEYINLSDREKEILQQLAEGFSTKEIADRLFLSVNTVETHRKNILFKTGLRNTAHLIKWGFENGQL